MFLGVNTQSFTEIGEFHRERARARRIYIYRPKKSHIFTSLGIFPMDKRENRQQKIKVKIGPTLSGDKSWYTNRIVHYFGIVHVAHHISAFRRFQPQPLNSPRPGDMMWCAKHNRLYRWDRGSIMCRSCRIIRGVKWSPLSYSCQVKKAREAGMVDASSLGDSATGLPPKVRAYMRLGRLAEVRWQAPQSSENFAHIQRFTSRS